MSVNNRNSARTTMIALSAAVAMGGIATLTTPASAACSPCRAKTTTSAVVKKNPCTAVNPCASKNKRAVSNPCAAKNSCAAKRK